jgi:hypothetical protein
MATAASPRAPSAAKVAWCSTGTVAVCAATVVKLPLTAATIEQKRRRRDLPQLATEHGDKDVDITLLLQGGLWRWSTCQFLLQRPDLRLPPTSGLND